MAFGLGQPRRKPSTLADGALLRSELSRFQLIRPTRASPLPSGQRCGFRARDRRPWCRGKPRWLALVRLPDGGRDDPSPNPSRDHEGATNGSRASGRQHSVQDSHSDRAFSLLGIEAACPQPRSDQRLVVTHHRFNQRTSAISGRRPPGQSSAVGDHAKCQSRCVGEVGSVLGTAVERGGITALMPSPCAAIVW